MNKKTFILAIVLLSIVTVIITLLSNRPKNSLSSPQSLTLVKQSKIVQPSETSIDYTDPSGFSFSYPDNLSIAKNEVDNNSYADLILSSKEVNGSLNLKISDSKFKSLEEWVKLNEKATVGTPRDVTLGKLKAVEIVTTDRLLLGSLDQGIFFDIEIPLVEKEFWMKVKDKITTNFSFVSSTTATSGSTAVSSESDVSFEGEEVVQ